MSSEREVEAPVPLTVISSSSEFGGAEGLMLSILDGLGPEWAKLVVFLGEGPVVGQVRERGVPVAVLPPAHRAGLLSAAVHLRRLLAEAPARVVHANGVRAAAVATLATLGTRSKVVWLKVDASRDGIVARTIAGRCARVVGISASVNETFRGRARDRCRVVYPGIRARSVDRSSAREMVAGILGCPSDAEIVVLAARLTPSKGQLDLIEATPVLLAERPGVRVALLGGETWPWEGYEADLRARARELGVQDAITFLGHRPAGVGDANDVVRFIGGCDVLAAPSRFEPASGWKEGFGYSPLEAMSVGVPVVAYRHGSFPEVLGECAWLAPEGDSRGLADGIVRVLSDPQVADRLVRCGSQRVARYSPESAVAGMRSVYREVAATIG